MSLAKWWYDGMAKNRKHDNVKRISAERWKEIKEKFPHLPVCKDIDSPRREAILRFPRFVEDWLVKHLLEDPRDVIMVSTMMNLSFFILISITTLSMYPSHILGLLVTATNVILFEERFILMLHYAAHRRLFKKKYSLLNKFLPYVIAPFYGIPTAMYECHHIVMHHTENNLFPGDLSSTEPHRRDSIFHWLHYLAKYYLCLIQLPLYAFKKGRMDRFSEVAIGEALWISTIVAMFWSGYGVQCTWLFVVPMVVASMAMMFGNFSQHIFIDPTITTMPQKKASYQYNCALAIQCINSENNLFSFNDGYHITHHINSRLHWTEMAWHFYHNLEKYAQYDPMVFEGVSFFDVGAMVMAGQHKKLYSHYVHLGKQKTSFEEFTQKLNSKLEPIDQSKRISGAIDSKVGN